MTQEEREERATRPNERELVTGGLSGDARFRLIVSGVVGSKEIDRLIKKLELEKEILQDSEDDDSLSVEEIKKI